MSKIKNSRRSFLGCLLGLGVVGLTGSSKTQTPKPQDELERKPPGRKAMHFKRGDHLAG